MIISLTRKYLMQMVSFPSLLVHVDFALTFHVRLMWMWNGGVFVLDCFTFIPLLKLDHWNDNVNTIQGISVWNIRHFLFVLEHQPFTKCDAFYFIFFVANENMQNIGNNKLLTYYNNIILVRKKISMFNKEGLNPLVHCDWSYSQNFINQAKSCVKFIDLDLNLA